MEEEIAVAQLLQYGLPVTRSASFANFTSAALYELLTAALTKFAGANGEEDQQQQQQQQRPSFLGAENATIRFHLLSTLAARLQRAGCDFVSPDHLMYPTERTTRRILMWLIAALHRMSAANSVKDDVKWQQTPMAQAIRSFHSVVQRHTSCEKKNTKASIARRGSLMPAVPTSFVAVGAQERREGGVQPPLWQQFRRGYDFIQGSSHRPEEAPCRPQWREVLLNSFQEVNAVERACERELPHHCASEPLMTGDTSGMGDRVESPQASLRRAHEKQSAPASLHRLKAYGLAADVFFFNTSEDEITVQGTTIKTLTACEVASEVAMKYPDASSKSEAQAPQDKSGIPREYSEAKKELRQLKRRLADLAAEKAECDEEVEMLQVTYGKLCSERERHKEETGRLEQALALLDTPEESAVQLERQVAELVAAREGHRKEVEVKLQKVEQKHAELLGQLRAVGGDHEEQLLKLGQAVQGIQRQIVEKERNVQQWQKNVQSLNVTDIDLSHFLSFIYEMTSNVCRQQAQIASVERDTAANRTRIEELENRLRLSFFKQESEVYKRAMVFDDGNVFQRLHKTFLGVRDGYQALIHATVKHGELLLELQHMEDQLQKLRLEVGACDTEKLKTDLADLRINDNSSCLHGPGSGR